MTGAAFAVVLAEAFFAVDVDLAAVFVAGAFLAIDFAAVDFAAVDFAWADFAAVDRVPAVFAAGAFFAVALVVDLAAAFVAGAFFAAVDLDVAFAAVAFAVVAFAGTFFAAVDFDVAFAAVTLAAALRFAGTALSFVDLAARVALDATFLTAPAAFVAALAGDVFAVVRVGISASSTAEIDVTERAAVRPVNAPRRTHAPRAGPHVAPFVRPGPGRRPPPHPPIVASGPIGPAAAFPAIRPHSVVNHPKNRSASCRSPPTDIASRPRRP